MMKVASFSPLASRLRAQTVMTFLAADALLPVSSSQATTALIDFGDAASTTLSLGAAPANDPNNYWNNFTPGLFSIANVTTTTGTATGFSIIASSRFNASNLNGTTASTIYPQNATRDSLYGNTEAFNGLSNIFPVVTLTGLDLATAYTFSFYASRTGVTDNRTARYSVTGANSAFAELNASNNVNNTVSVFSIIPDVQGQINIALTPGAANNNANHFTYLGVLTVDYPAVPEPTTWAMLVGGLLALVSIPRLRSKKAVTG